MLSVTTLQLLLLVFYTKAYADKDNMTATITTEDNATTAYPTTVTTMDGVCNSNDSTCSTAMNVVTTVATNTSTTNSPVTTTKRPKFKKSQFEDSSDICTCDLQRKFCEINCCCDKDCSMDDKQVFQGCIVEHNFRRDTSYCQYVDYIYLNHTPYLWEMDQNGFFCIAKTNLPKQYTVQKIELINSLEEAELQKRNRPLWTKLDENVESHQSFNPNEHFMFGSNMWMVQNNILTLFQLPDRFVTNACLIKKNMKYLQNFKSQCIQTQIDQDNFSLDPETYKNMSILRAPKYFNATKFGNNLMECPKNVCVPIINTQICDDNYNNCHISSNYSFSCSLSTINGKNSCFFVTESVKYNFYHNGTKGITQVELFLILKNITYELNEKKIEFIQNFEVNYFWTNYTLNYSSILSGNPGYLIGKPILIANLVNVLNTTNSTANNETVIVRSEIKRNNYDFTDNFLVLPLNKEGLCILNNKSNLPIEFGYNMITKCKLKAEFEVQNRTGDWVCKNIQKLILNFWPISHKNLTDINKLVGTFGNANESISKDWIEILTNKSPLEILNYTSGNWTNANKTILCKNITTQLNIDIFHSRIDYEHFVNQEKILATTFLFGQAKNLEFGIANKKVVFEIELREQVMFFDITTDRVKKFVGPPSFRISWPHDFFYPFIKVGNIANKLSCSYLMFVLFICLKLCDLFV